MSSITSNPLGWTGDVDTAEDVLASEKVFNVRDLMNQGKGFHLGICIAAQEYFQYLQLRNLRWEYRDKPKTLTELFKEPIAMTFRTAEGTLKVMHLGAGPYAPQYVSKLFLRSYQACTSKTRFTTAYGECPVFPILESGPLKEDEAFYRQWQDERERCSVLANPDGIAYGFYSDDFGCYKAVMDAVRSMLDKTPVINKVAAFDCGCVNDATSYKKIMLVAEMAQEWVDHGISQGTSPKDRFPVVYDDSHACKKLEDHFRSKHPKLHISRGGVSSEQLSDLGYPRDKEPESAEEILKQFTISTLDQNSFIVCIDPKQAIRQAAMEITSSVGPAGMLCKRIVGDDVPLSAPHEDPGDPDPSSTRLLIWKDHCHEIPLGVHFGKELALYLRKAIL